MHKDYYYTEVFHAESGMKLELTLSYYCCHNTNCRILIGWSTPQLLEWVTIDYNSFYVSKKQELTENITNYFEYALIKKLPKQFLNLLQS